MGFIGRQPTPVPLTSSDITDGIISTAKIADDAVENTKLDLSANYAFTGTLSGVGKVLQVVNAVTTGSTNSQSTSEVAYQTVSITPSSTSSKILVGAEGAGSVICGSNGILQCNLYRGGTSDTLIARFYSGLGSTTNGHEHYITGRCLVVDSPSTTSAQTYTFSGQKGSGGTTSARLMAGSDFPIVMFAIEIGP
tara:strand:+ start:4962 stop:5543 length:582 start_codon:yes stop_codon:yes gene_type:complete